MIGMTQEQFDRLQALKPAIAYTQEEVSFLLDMTNLFVDQYARVCFTCSSSISDLKQSLYSWLNENEQVILEELAAQQQVENYSNNNEPNTP